MASLKITSDTDLVRIDLTDGDWIEVKRALGKDDERRRTSIMLRGQKSTLEGAGDMEVDFGALFDTAPFATLEVALKHWSLKDPTTNRVAPITRTTIRAIGDEDMEIIAAELEKLYGEPLTEEQEKNS